MGKENGPIREGSYDAEVKKKKKSIVEVLVTAAKKIVNKAERDRKTNPPKNTNLESDVDKVMQRPPTKKEIEKLQTGELGGFVLQPKEITLDKEMIDELDLKLAEHEDRNPTMVALIRQETPRDARSAKLAIEMLDQINEQDEANLTQQLREVAQELWRYRVGSGYTNIAAEDAYNYLWEIRDRYAVDLRGIDKYQADAFNRDLTEMIKSAAYPPEIVIQPATLTNLGSLRDSTVDTVDQINAKYRDYSFNPKHPDVISRVKAPPTDDFIIEQLAIDLQAMQDIVKSPVGQNATPEELLAFNSIQMSLIKRRDELKVMEAEEKLFVDEDAIVQKLQLEERQRRIEEQNSEIRTPSDFNLTQPEAKRLIERPIETMQAWLEEIEAAIVRGSFDNSEVGSLFKRYNLALSYFLMDEYQDERLASLGFDLENKELIKATKAGLKDQQRAYIKEFSARFNSVKFLEAKSRAGSFEDEGFRGAVRQMRANDFLDLQTLYGGLVESAGNIMARQAMQAIRGPHGLTDRLTEVKKIEVIKNTADFMRKNGSHFKDVYDKYKSGVYFEIEMGSNQSLLREVEGSVGIDRTYEQAVDSIVNLAALDFENRFRWEELELRGYNPLQSNQFNDEVAYHVKGRFLNSKRRRHKWSIEQWGSVQGRPALDRAHHREGALLWAKHYSHDLHHEIDHETDHFIEQFKRADISKVIEGKDEDKLMKKLKYLFFWNPDIATEWKDDDWEKLALDLHHGNKRDLIAEEFKVQFGIDIDDMHGVKAYTPFESKWRAEVVDVVIDNLLGGKDGSTIFGEKKNALFTARDLIGDAKTYFGEKLSHHEPSKKAGEKFWTTINHTLKFRPHDFGDMLLEMEDQDFIHLVEHDPMFGRDINETLSEMGMVVSETNGSLFRSVMELTNKTDIPNYCPIDFSTPFERWTPEQRKAFKTVTTSMISGDTDVEEYASRFKQLYELINNEKIKKKFGNVRYEDILTSAPRWYDDLPITLLQRPDRLKFLGADERKQRLSLGDFITGAGRSESDDLFKRTFNDDAALEKAAAALDSIPLANEHDLQKLLVQAFQPVAQIHGGEHGAILQEMEQYKWEKMRAQNRWFASSHDSTLFRKYSGDQKADIVYREEAQKMQEEMFALTVNSNAAIPALMHVKEEELRIANWNKWFESVPGNPIKKLIFARYAGETDSEKERKYHQFVHFLNDMYPNQILKDKLWKTTLTALALAALFLFYQYVQEGMGATQAAGGSSHSGGGGSSLI